MKFKFNKIYILAILALSVSCTGTYFSSSGGYDDVYDSAPPYTNTVNANASTKNNEDYALNGSDQDYYSNENDELTNGDTYITNNYYDDEEYNYYQRGGTYSSRIDRFHRPNNFSYYNRYNSSFYGNSFYGNSWQDPFFNPYSNFGSGFNMSLSFGFGNFNPYGYHINRFHPYGGFNNFYSPFDQFGFYGNPYNNFGNVYNFYGNGFCPSPFNNYNHGFYNGYSFYDYNRRNNVQYAPRNGYSSNSYNQINGGSGVQSTIDVTPNINVESSPKPIQVGQDIDYNKGIQIEKEVKSPSNGAAPNSNGVIVKPKSRPSYKGDYNLDPSRPDQSKTPNKASPAPRPNLQPTPNQPTKSPNYSPSNPRPAKSAYPSKSPSRYDGGSKSPSPRPSYNAPSRNYSSPPRPAPSNGNIGIKSNTRVKSP